MKKFTHVVAVAFGAVAAFFVTPAGQSLAHQYPWLTPIVAIAGVGATYFNPQKP